MSSITCSDCGLRFRFSREEDNCVCPNPLCCKEQPTGLEGRIRKKIEKYVNLDLPKMTVGRAVGFAAAIYEFSTHNDRIDVGSIENRLQKRTGMQTGMEKSSLKMIATRANGGLVDNRTGLMIYVISGTTGHTSWTTAFVDFRGSRGTPGGDDENPQGAGWDDSTGESHNLDWAANFTNAQVPAPWRRV